MKRTMHVLDHYPSQGPQSKNARIDAPGSRPGQATYAAWTDGASRANPGPAASGWVLKSPSGELIEEGGRYIGTKTNNEAEYDAVIQLLQTCKKRPFIKRVDIKSDSKLVVMQVAGKWKVKQPHLQPLVTAIQKERSRDFDFTLSHVRREFNAHADRMANEALDRRGVVCRASDVPTSVGSGATDVTSAAGDTGSIPQVHAHARLTSAVGDAPIGKDVQSGCLPAPPTTLCGDKPVCYLLSETGTGNDGVVRYYALHSGDYNGPVRVHQFPLYDEDMPTSLTYDMANAMRVKYDELLALHRNVRNVLSGPDGGQRSCITLLTSNIPLIEAMNTWANQATRPSLARPVAEAVASIVALGCCCLRAQYTPDFVVKMMFTRPQLTIHT